MKLLKHLNGATGRIAFPLLAGLLIAGLTAMAQTAKKAQAASRSWASDNGNGTYSNPLFYDEFSDPDMIRVGSDYYLTGTTMHTMPGLPILHSRDLVNWRIIAYAFDRLDLGPDFRLEDGKNIYGGGIWAKVGAKLHLREREPLRPPGLPGHQPARPVEAQPDRTGAPRSLRLV